MQSEITEETDLFDDKGNLIQTGWAKRLLLNYKRDKVRAGSLRIKEWDCYVMLNPEFGLSLIVADIGYFGMATVNWQNHVTKEGKGRIGLKMFTRGKLNLPPTADTGDVLFEKGKKWIKFETNLPNRKLSFEFPQYKFKSHKGISGEINLTQDPKLETMVNVIPFKSPKHFVYVQKIVCMPAVGNVHVGGETYEFKGEENNSWC